MSFVKIFTHPLIERNAAMEQLKVFGRNAANADPIFTREVSEAEAPLIWLGLNAT